jgi:hypothetical protein
MRLLAVAISAVLAISLAGCSDDAAPEETVETGDVVVDASHEISYFQGEFSLLVNPDPEFIAIGGASFNCVFFWDTSGAAYEWFNGNATLTWDALPNAQLLRLRTMGAAEELAAGPAGSPLVLEFDNLTVGHEWGIGFWVDYSVLDRTMPVAQQVKLDINFEFTGELPEPSIGTCAGGGA